MPDEPKQENLVGIQGKDGKKENKRERKRRLL